MAKFQSLDEYVATFQEDGLLMYKQLKEVVLRSDQRVKEKLFAGQVAFYVEETLGRTFHASPVIVMSFLKDHVNIFASGNVVYKNELKSYAFTDKGTMQIKYQQDLKEDVLQKLFARSLTTLGTEG